MQISYLVSLFALAVHDNPKCAYLFTVWDLRQPIIGKAVLELGTISPCFANSMEVPVITNKGAHTHCRSAREVYSA